jgi:hypothetical protein
MSGNHRFYRGGVRVCLAARTLVDSGQWDEGRGAGRGGAQRGMILTIEPSKRLSMPGKLKKRPRVFVDDPQAASVLEPDLLRESERLLTAVSVSSVPGACSAHAIVGSPAAEAVRLNMLGRTCAF